MGEQENGCWQHIPPLPPTITITTLHPVPIIRSTDVVVGESSLQATLVLPPAAEEDKTTDPQNRQPSHLSSHLLDLITIITIIIIMHHLLIILMVLL